MMLLAAIQHLTGDTTTDSGTRTLIGVAVVLGVMALCIFIGTLMTGKRT